MLTSTCVSVPGCGVCELEGGLRVSEYCSVSVSGWCVCQQTGGRSAGLCGGGHRGL